MFGDATTFHLTIVSAKNLHCPDRIIGQRIKVHAEIRQDDRAIRKTETDGAGGKNPMWNFDAHYPITDFIKDRKLVVRLYYKRSVGYTPICEVEIDVSILFDMWRDSRVKAKTYHVQGDPQSILNIRFEFT